jgi:prepilin-type N-terminal cleavage/methylation domain-containing protein
MMSKISPMALHLIQHKFIQSKLNPQTRLGNAIHQKGAQGMTLMECLVAISVIALTSAMIGPPLVLAAATRVQNRRVEQSIQVAQAEIDRIRTLVTLSEYSENNLPAITSAANLQAQAGPSSTFSKMDSVNASCPQDSYSDEQVDLTKALPVDLDGDCEADFLVQTFRTEGTFTQVQQARRFDDDDENTGEARPTTFTVMVRVYAASAASNYGSLGTEPASLQFTSGEGNQRERPLTILTSDMSLSDTDSSLFCYHNDDCSE